LVKDIQVDTDTMEVVQDILTLVHRAEVALTMLAEQVAEVVAGVEVDFQMV
jgi:hypothetical protein